MKQLIFSLLFGCTVTIAFSQDLKKAKSYIDSKQLDKAKTEIDGYVAKSPADAEGLYYKAKIYQLVADAAQYKSTDNVDAGQEALDAFKKAWGDGKDPKITLIALKDQYAPVFNLYTGYYQAGANAFNGAATSGNKAGFADAMNYFIRSNDVGQYIYQQKWSKIAEVDTVLVLNIGKAALNAGKDDIALIYFKKIADANINGVKDGGDGNSVYMLPYQWLTLHYKDAKDSADMMKYASLGKRLFPKEDYFDLVLIDYYRDKKNNDALFAKYNELVTNRPDSLMYHFNYANDIFGYLYNGDEGVVVKNKDTLMHTLGDQIEKAHTINPNDVLTNWLYAQYYYNQGVDIRNLALKVKGVKPEDVKKKADLNAQAKVNFNKSVPYGEKALSSLEATTKKSDKSRYKSIADLMQKIYESMNQSDKVKLYQDKYDGADAKFVN
jgi:hypothetical protein